MGEGAGMMVIEDELHALERGAKIYAEITGCGLAGEAYHIISPLPDGAAAQKVMKKAATASTSRNLRVSSIKGAVGHLLGASGAVEAISTVLSLYNNKIPVTSKLTQLHPDIQDDKRLHIVFMVGQTSSVDYKIRRTISNSSGFGGANIAI